MTKSMTEKELADALIKDGMTALEDAMLGKDALNDLRTGDYQAWTKTEHDEFQAFLGLVSSYLALKDPKRPLCLAVFGPPGAGKSFGVRKAAEILTEKGTSLLWREINLTQVGSTAQLGGLLAASGSGDGVPLVFFDEFDAPLNGTALGWLSWFLAPMQDGKFDASGPQTLSRAIYVFAGGTAATYGEFSGRRDKAFVAAKGPDFVSRLRGYLDVRGPNEPERRTLRRAAILCNALTEVSKARGVKETTQAEQEETGTAPLVPVRLSKDLREDLLQVGRYRHGARSIGAVLELTAYANSTPELPLDRKHLPIDHLLAIHADAGPLDASAIGGLIGISGGGPADAELEETWSACAMGIWSQGGSVAYGGSWDGLTAKLSDALKASPPVLSNAPKPDPRLYIFAESAPTAPLSDRERVVAIPPRPAPGALGRVLQMFSTRWLMTCRCRARVLMSGKVAGYSGRMPGVFEEGMLALAAGQPIYVIGAHGGAAELFGNVLGLSQSHNFSFPPLDLLIDPKLIDNAALFSFASARRLPATFREAVAYVQRFAPNGKDWPDNGLSFEENQELFNLKPDKTTRISELLLKGLTRTFS